MNELLALVLPALAQALLHFLWQGVLIGAAAALALRSMRGTQRQWRHAVACVALFACGVMPFATLAVQLAPATFVARSVPFEAARASITDAVASTTVGWASAQPWFLLLWALGAACVASRMLVGRAWARGLPTCDDLALGELWQRRLDALAQRFGLRRRVALRLVDGIDTPATFGWWRPVVLLPTALIARLPTELLEALLAHELAHVRRLDPLVKLGQSIVEALLFYHPVVWWLSRRIDSEREELADGLATDCACTPRGLARALAALAEWQAPRPVLAASGGSLLARIERLLMPAPRPLRRSPVPLRLGVALAGLGAICVASFAFALGSRDGERAASSPDTGARASISTRDTYVLVHGGRASAWGPHDAADAEALSLGLDGDFFFAHRAGGLHVVSDAALVERARRSWRAYERVAQRIEGLEASYRRALEPHGGPPRDPRIAERDARALSLRLQSLQQAQDRAGQHIAVESRAVLDAAFARGIARPVGARVESLR